MAELREKVRRRLISKGFDPEIGKLDFRLMLEVWGLYDRYFFRGQITKRMMKTYSSLDYEVVEGGKGLSGKCMVEKTENGSEIRCSFILKFPEKYPSEPGMINGIECPDEMGYLQVAMEHEIIHIIMRLYGYQDLDRGKTNVYTAHGLLFECLAREYFGHESGEHVLP